MITIREENIPWESKRDSKCPYWYITKHGIGPGTLPKDVKIGKYKDLDNYYTVIWIDRPLSTDELKYYDIYPETMNNKILDRLGISFEELEECNESLKEEMYHHIDNGYSMIDISHTKPIDIIKGWKLTFDGTLDEVDNAFYFEEDEFGGFGGTQFFGIGLLRNSALKNKQADTYSFDQSDFIKFKFWFNVNLYGDNEDETKIYVDIDNSLIDTDLFEYEVMDEETNIPVDEADDIMFDMAYEIGEAIYSVIQANVTGFGYSKSR
jgi:hypothetical protein